jgi:hypothetical protein
MKDSRETSPGAAVLVSSHHEAFVALFGPQTVPPPNRNRLRSRCVGARAPTLADRRPPG